MSTEDLAQGGLRVGRWVPDTPTGATGEPGTVYRGGSLAVSQMRVEPVDGAAVEEPAGRGLRVVAGVVVAVAVLGLSLITLFGSGRTDAAREVGTMRYPAPTLPAPPALPSVAGVPGDPPVQSGRASTATSGAAPVAPRTPTAGATGPDGSPAPVVVKPPVSASAGPPPPGPTAKPLPTPPGQDEITVPLVAGATVSLETMTRPGHVVRHDATRAVVGRVGLGSSAEERSSARFVVRAGLGDARCVSFESEDRPGRFLRHWKFAVYLHRPHGGSVFAKDATFCPVAGADGRHTSLRSRNYPDRYLTVRSSLLFLDRADGAAEARTFAVRPGA